MIKNSLHVFTDRVLESKRIGGRIGNDGRRGPLHVRRIEAV